MNVREPGATREQLVFGFGREPMAASAAGDDAGAEEGM